SQHSTRLVPLWRYNYRFSRALFLVVLLWGIFLGAVLIAEKIAAFVPARITSIKKSNQKNPNLHVQYIVLEGSHKGQEESFNVSVERAARLGLAEGGTIQVKFLFGTAPVIEGLSEFYTMAPGAIMGSLLLIALVFWLVERRGTA